MATTNRPTRPGTRTATEAVTGGKPTDTAPAPDNGVSKPVESEASKASRTAPLDLAALSEKVAKVERPERTVTRKGTPLDNSVAERWLQSLEDERKGAKFSPSARKLPITAGILGVVRSRLNVAGATLKAGVGMSLEDGRDIATVVKAVKDGKVKEDAPVVLVYWTQTRKQSKAEKEAAAAKLAAEKASQQNASA